MLAFPKRELPKNRVKGILPKSSDAFVRIDPLSGDGLIPHHRNGLGSAIAVRGHQDAALFGPAGMAAETAGNIERIPPVPAAISQEIKNRICTCHNIVLLHVSPWICTALNRTCAWIS